MQVLATTTDKLWLPLDMLHSLIPVETKLAYLSALVIGGGFDPSTVKQGEKDEGRQCGSFLLNELVCLMIVA